MGGRVTRLAVATATLGSALLLPIAPYAAAAPVSTAPLSSNLLLSLTSVTPAVVTDDGAVTVIATLQNTGSTAVSAPTVVIRQDIVSLRRRSDVAGWAASTSAGNGSVIASTTAPRPIAPGREVSVTLTVNQVGAGRAATYGVVPVSVEATSGAVAARVHTFLGYQRVKQYVPLDVAVAVPLVLDADPRLSGTGSGREGAWQAVAGPQSRLDRVLAATSDAEVTWILDPSLTRPAIAEVTGSGTPTATTTSTPTASTPTAGATSTAGVPTAGATSANGASAPADAYAASAAEAQVRGDLGDRIRAGAASHAPVVLPVADPDLASSGVDPRVLDADRTQVDAARIASGVTPAELGVAWPASGAWTPRIEQATRAAYGPSLSAALVDSAWFASSDTTPTAEQRSAGNLPLVVYDDTLSTLLARTKDRSQAVLSTQQLVADTVTLVNERPGTQRSVALVAPRDLDPDPAALSGLLTALGTVPWIVRTPMADLLTGAQSEAAIRSVPATKLPAAPPALLGARSAATLFDDLRTVHAMSAVRADPAAFAPPWQQAGERLLAASWRTHRTGWATLRTDLKTAAASASEGLYVSPRQINFLADTGRVQITIVNALDVAVHDVSLTLRPDNPRLRIDDPAVMLRIGARSKTTVTFKATALAAGQVPVTTTLAAPDGTIIRTDAPVRISVTPTGDWMYWVLGAIAGTILVVGIWRGLRHGKPPVPVVPAADRVAS